MMRIFSKVKRQFKRQWRKIKYLDKIQLSYFVVTTFIGAFCLFTGGTYSYFTITKNLNSATITIAKLSYNLSSTTEGYNNGNISVPAGEIVIVDLSLDSLNAIETKYALNYSSESSNVEVFYSENLRNNMQGLIGPTGSNQTMRVVIVNNGTAAATVNLTATGGYIKNTLTSNITKGYYEKDLTIRTILLDENLDNGLIEQDFPSKDGEYAYFRTQCSKDADVVWDADKWDLGLGSVGEQIACDTYFKKMAYDIETYFGLRSSDGSITFSLEAPSAEEATLDNVQCNTVATATWDETTGQFVISGAKDKTICIGYFDEN